MKTSEWEKSFEDRPARTALRLGLTIVGIMAVLSVVIWLIGMALFPAQQAGRVLTKTFDADNMIYNYEWFKRQNQDVQAIGTKLTAAEQAQSIFEQSAGSRDGWKFDDRTEWNRLNTIVLGLRNQRASMVAEYNARSEMANRSIFKTGDLPLTLQ